MNRIFLFFHLGEKYFIRGKNLIDIPMKNTETPDQKSDSSSTKTSYFKKYALILMMLSIAASFVFFDIMSFSSQPPTSLARIGDRTIDIKDVQKKYNDLREQYRSISPEFLKLVNLNEMAARAALSDYSLSEYARSLGVKVPDSDIQTFIESIPELQNLQGDGVDRKKLDYFLDVQNITADDFIQNITDISLQQKMGSYLSLTPFLTEDFLAYHTQKTSETRTIKWVKISPETLDIQINPPSEKELKEYYDRHKNHPDFYRDQHRDISYLHFTPEALTSYFKTSTTDIQTYYDTHRDQFTQPAQYDTYQLSFDTQEEAKIIYQKLKQRKNINLKNILALGFKKEDIHLGMITKNDGLNADIFSLKKGHMSDIIQDSFGTKIYYINDITEEKVTSFSDAKASIEQEILKEKFKTFKRKHINTIEDNFAGGATLQEIASLYQLTPLKQMGLTEQAIVTPPLSEDVIQSFFNTQDLEEIIYKNFPDGSFLYGHVLKIDPARAKTFDEAKEEMTTAYIQEKTHKQFTDSYQKIDTEYKKLSFDSLLKKYELTLKSKDITAQDTQLLELPPQVKEMLFNAQEKKIMLKRNTDPRNPSAILAFVDRITYPKLDQEKTKTITAQLRNDITQSQQYKILNHIQQTLGLEIFDLYNQFIQKELPQQ